MPIGEQVRTNPALRRSLVIGVLALIVVAGSFGSWVSLSSATLDKSDSLNGVDASITKDPTPWLLASGTVGVNEGVATALLAVAGAVAGLGAARSRGQTRMLAAWATAGAFGLVALISIVDWFMLQRFIDSTGPTVFRGLNDRSGQDLKLQASVEWGLWLVTVASIGATTFALHAARRVAVVERLAPTVARTIEPVPGSRFATGRLGIVEAGQCGRVVEVRDGQRLIVGRAPTVELRLADERVSRRHLEIKLNGGEWSVMDLGAMNRASVFTHGVTSELPAGATTRLDNGQVAIGGAVLTLYPAAGS